MIAFIAADLAALRSTLPIIPNPGLVVMILVLEVGLFRLASRRGAERTFWLGFEIAGWAYVITCSIFSRAAWRLARSIFEGYILKRPIGPPFELTRFLLFAGGFQLSISLAIALLVGLLARAAWRRRGALATNKAAR